MARTEEQKEGEPNGDQKVCEDVKVRDDSKYNNFETSRTPSLDHYFLNVNLQGERIDAVGKMFFRAMKMYFLELVC